MLSVFMFLLLYLNTSLSNYSKRQFCFVILLLKTLQWHFVTLCNKWLQDPGRTLLSLLLHSQLFIFRTFHRTLSQLVSLYLSFPIISPPPDSLSHLKNMTYIIPTYPSGLRVNLLPYGSLSEMLHHSLQQTSK